MRPDAGPYRLYDDMACRVCDDDPIDQVAAEPATGALGELGSRPLVLCGSADGGWLLVTLTVTPRTTCAPGSAVTSPSQPTKEAMT